MDEDYIKPSPCCGDAEWAIVDGRYDVTDVLSGFDDPAVHAMADRVVVVVDPDPTQSVAAAT